MAGWRHIMKSVAAAAALFSTTVLVYADDVSKDLGQLQIPQQMPSAQSEAVHRAPERGLTPILTQRNGGATVPDIATLSGRSVDSDKPGGPRLRGGDTILLSAHRPGMEDHSQPEQLIGKKIFVLDRAGGLVLPEVGRIIVAGLNEQEAAARIAAEPVFGRATVAVKLIPVDQELKPFGYDLFRRPAGAFAPITDIPVPDDYVVGPGDTVVVQLYGKENAQHELKITRDGLVPFPGIGPIPVAGLTYSKLQREIQKRVQLQLSGVKASVTLGRIRSIRVFVLGDVETPGSIVVSGLATMTNALYASGGVKPIGSLRNIQLKRNDKVISRMDLYDLLLRGDTGADAHLLPGDVIFVPTSGKKVGIAGQVRRPGIYELKGEKTISDLISTAGGLLPDAFLKKAQVVRIRDNRERILLDIDLTQPADGLTMVHSGDIIRINPVLDEVQRSVSLSGHVIRPGRFQWFSGMRVTDLIPSISDLKTGADRRYLLVKREDPENGMLELLSANLDDALDDRAGDSDLLLQPMDEVHVFDMYSSRKDYIRPLLDIINAQSGHDRPVDVVSVEGMIHHPGRYPLSPDMRISDLLRAAGGLTDRAYTLEAELTRQTIVDGQDRILQQLDVDIAALLDGSELKDLSLDPYDHLVVRRIPGWDDVGAIEIKGEVRFPGTYPIVPGEQLSSVIARAGGLTDDAYPKAAVFLRESTREREQKSIEQLAARLEHELSLVQASDADEAVAEGQVLLKQIKAAKAAGRMVIHPDALLREETTYDVTVLAGDKLYIPRRPEEVTVIGEVYNPTSHLHDKGLDKEDYIRLSGGITEYGNKKAIYVIHEDGSVSTSRGWFGKKIRIGPGNVIVVPVNVDRLSKLKVITSVSQVLYQLALTAASLKVLDVF